MILDPVVGIAFKFCFHLQTEILKGRESCCFMVTAIKGVTRIPNQCCVKALGSV